MTTHPTIGTVAMGDTEAFKAAIRNEIARREEAGYDARVPLVGPAEFNGWTDADLVAALSARPAQEPVLYVSEQQLEQCIGTYLPTRKEAEGNFQLALYLAAPQPVLSQPEVKADVAALEKEIKDLKHDLASARGQAKNATSNLDYWRGQYEALCPLSDIPAQAGEVDKAVKFPLPSWKEQAAFEEWANDSRYEMAQHPLHYLFMDKQTNAARQGWKAALAFVRKLLEVAPPVNAMGNKTGGERT